MAHLDFTPIQSLRPVSLTRHEWTGLTAGHNLADGHARQSPSPAAASVLDRLGSIYTDCASASQLSVQRAFEREFYELAGQKSVHGRSRGPQHHYSSSLSIEVVANLLRHRGWTVGLLHPTFDNIPAILRRHGVPLIPVDESVFRDPADPRYYAGLNALFLVTPNNPTGTDPAAETLRAIADQCRQRGMTLILDFSFRFFSRHLGGHDFYEYLEDIGASYIGIEDSGKTWPTLDLKVGSLLADDETYDALQEITDDVLLNVSPFIFALLEEHIRHEGIADSLRISTVNRRALTKALEGGLVRLPLQDSTMSVALLQLPEGWDGEELCAWLEWMDVSVLPGGPFYWDRREEGARHVRIALMRPVAEFAESARVLADAFEQYARERQDDGAGVRQVARDCACDQGAADANTDSTDPDRVRELALEGAADLLSVERISADDDFFMLGGDSLTAMHFVGRMAHTTGLPLRMSVLFDHPVLGDFAEEVVRLAARGAADGRASAAPDPAAALRASFGLLGSAEGKS